eukprot:TCONS_00014678-protein
MASSNQWSQSVKWRTEGNQLYQTAQKDGFGPTIKKSRLQEAMKCYQRALSAANGDKNETSSACKNLARANYAVSLLSKDDTVQEMYFLRETFHYYSKALESGEGIKPSEWLTDVDALYRALFVEICEKFNEAEPKEKVVRIESFVSVISESDCMYPDLQYNLALTWINEACVGLNNKDFKASLNALKECYRPVEELKRYGKHRDDLANDIDCFGSDIALQTARTESMQAIDTGDSLLEQHLQNDSDINMDLIYTVIDYYRHAMVLTRDVEIELEAIALSRLGKLYDKVLKIKYRASECFKKCLEIASTLVPRVLTTELWYQVASEALQRYQRENLQNQEEEKRNQRKKYIDELKTELEEIAEAKKKWKKEGGKFLMFIYEKFPPKVTCTIPKKEDVVDKEMKSLKKLFQKAVIYYHPDKQDVERFGMKWKVLSEEITKDLSTFYEITKGMTD